MVKGTITKAQRRKDTKGDSRMERNGRRSRIALPLDAEDIAAKAAVDSAYRVHRKLGPGLLERVYEKCMAHELAKRGLRVRRQVAFPVIYDDLRIDAGFRIDLLVNECLVLELKVVEQIMPVHRSQLLTYLKLTDRRLGLLINFNVPIIKKGITRMIL